MAKIIITSAQIRANLGASLNSSIQFPYEVASCATCPAACCRENVRMPLTDKEAEFMRIGGTELEPLDSEPTCSERVRRMLGMSVTHDYRLGTDCGYLVEGEDGRMLCSAHEDDNRPSICRDFQADSYNCHELRFFSGLEPAENLVNFDALTRE